ncbi:MAG: T9SS type A sorting domain-containing protein, partial [Cyclobacteriaceae bacterium]|nr:T9SS type A sorting domain-containing protein [Cyclobacteriaceae bacterium]
VTRHEEEHYPLFAQDITTTQNTHTWRFTFESNILTGLVTLTWPKDELGPSNAALKLLDEQSGAIIDMRTTGSHTFRPDGAHAFSVFFSRDPNNEFLPDALILGHAWPNPARDKVHFPVVLSGNNELHDIELAIYNLEGKKIKVLADGRYKAGIHQFIWETREGGNSTAGVFIYRLEFKDGKMRPLQKKVVVSP